MWFGRKGKILFRSKTVMPILSSGLPVPCILNIIMESEYISTGAVAYYTHYIVGDRFHTVNYVYWLRCDNIIWSIHVVIQLNSQWLRDCRSICNTICCSNTENHRTKRILCSYWTRYKIIIIIRFHNLICFNIQEEIVEYWFISL